MIIDKFRSNLQSANQFMDVDEDNVQQKLFSPANHYNYTINNNDLLLKTKYYVGGATFQFHWNLTKCNSDVVSNPCKTIYCLVHKSVVFPSVLWRNYSKITSHSGKCGRPEKWINGNCEAEGCRNKPI